MSKARTALTRETIAPGVVLDAHTHDALKYVRRLLKRRGWTFAVRVGQGGYNAGGVSASAGTHDKGGVVDLRVSHLDDDERRALVRALKDTGFAAWYRRAVAGLWAAHIHAVLIGNADLAPVASRQVAAYDSGRDGLAGNRPDDTYRPTPRVKFSWTKGCPVPRK